MATIKINNLSPVGSELFQDSESFLNELTDTELATRGGLLSITLPLTPTLSLTWTYTVTAVAA
ncbi:hypothetical protein VF14_33340 [Nostoc linckia z18]|jgi:hypothetical protein|uniref:Bacteriocin n=2 Tax=Nostoc linckia TaxID=92942 RepID=A0A9Q5ZBX6_NOSLI|nr:hypothetical protein [Nostoc linckia]PHK39394.1 hypothetical protein VF12_14405 [Nostoc linckia z15]PHK40996.1 hypothetical protein VF13_32055 [Nostoc linckia z16]PHJ66952.1 hypothetical protein VF02_06440 [Nostoc linckia z1]PHJ67682.1 hypothetical protein VF05_16760 [Nostoc linckia z3]PHJ77213.1 hypothetical protein VF03_04995 [Nostoc linckia z2]